MLKNNSKYLEKGLAIFKTMCYNICVCMKALKEVKYMKEGIHPKYTQTVIRCACGNVIETGSTKENINVEVCAKCHPFYTGKQKLVDTGGRVEKFRKKFNLGSK